MAKHVYLLVLLTAALGAVLPGLAGCRKAPPAAPPPEASAAAKPAGAPGVEHPVVKAPQGGEAPAPAPSGTRELFIRTGCARCHGTDLAGSEFGPPLKDLKSGWTSDKLIAFLKDPAKARSTDLRLAELAGKYKTDMPAPELTDAELKLLADWLLAGGG